MRQLSFSAQDKISSSKTLPRKPKIAILYHFMYPDDVISARHLDGLAIDLSKQGWSVTAYPCNRSCRNEKIKYSRSDIKDDVIFKRIWRPPFRQASFTGRLLNSAWMIFSWTKLSFSNLEDRPDIILIGTDPIFGVLAAIPIKFFSPNIRLVHWCFDLHPEAAIASGIISPSNVLAKFMKKLMGAAYRRCDAIVDIGSCMKARLENYVHNAREMELTPWALVEPPAKVEANEKTRQNLFGSAKLTLLYSGNFGEAHSYKDILKVARILRHVPDIKFCFAVRGNKVDELKKAVTCDDTNICFAKFAPIEELKNRLGSADIHMTSLRPEWSGIAIPSKFFGSIATGRPVLFSGPKESAIAQWISEFGLGWVLTSENITEVAQNLENLVTSKAALTRLQINAHSIYKEQFSRHSVTQKWNDLLFEILNEHKLHYRSKDIEY